MQRTSVRAGHDVCSSTGLIPNAVRRACWECGFCLKICWHLLYRFEERKPQVARTTAEFMDVLFSGWFVTTLLLRKHVVRGRMLHDGTGIG